MTRLGWNPVVLLGASVTLAILTAACGLGDIPTRPPHSGSPETPGPTTAASPSPSPTTVASPTATLAPTPVPSPTSLVYTVKSGDSLLSIAKRFNTSARSIAFWNRAKYKSLDPNSPSYNPNTIEIGWRLTITPGVKLEDNGAAPGASPTG